MDILRAIITRRIHERIRGGNRLAAFLTRNMSSVPIEIEGYPPLYVDLRRLDEHALLLYRSSPFRVPPHEETLTKLFQQVILPSDVVFDVGANLGIHTLTFSKLARSVVAFEPNPALCPNVNRTLSGLPNARLLEVCLSENDGTVEFYISDWNHHLSSMANWSTEPSKTIPVSARSLDSLLSEGKLPYPDVLKVDVEGAEMKVFKGADALFSGPNAPRVVIFEELNTASRKMGISDGEAANYLSSKGYLLYLIGEEELSPLPAERPTAANLLAVNSSFVDHIESIDLR